jgi:hypothetical protein
VLHFIPEDAEAHWAVEQLQGALAPDSALVISHAASEPYQHLQAELDEAKGVYQRKTTTPARLRDRFEVRQFFAGTDLAEPGIVWVTEWRPEPHDPADFAGEPVRSGLWAGVGQVSPNES